MYNNYEYSHTFVLDQDQYQQKDQQKQKGQKKINRNQQPQQISDSNDLDDLFKIGGRDIIKSHGQGETDDKIKDKKEKKEKKIKKQDKKKKKQKQYKKQKKDKHKNKKVKEKNRQKQSDSNSQAVIEISDQSMQQQDRDQDAIQKLERKMELLSRYEKHMAIYQDSSQILEKDFGLKERLSEHSLPIDIIKFGLPELASYGIQDREVPRYKRPPLLQTIIGIRKKKRALRLMKELNMMTNQTRVNWAKYESTSAERYFHYTGYEKLVGEMPQKFAVKVTEQHKPTTLYEIDINNRQIVLSQAQQQINIEPSIPFYVPEQMKIKLPGNEEKVRLLNKEYNLALNANPHSIDRWLKFLHIQDKMSQLTLANSELDQSEKQRTALLERKISILEKALEKNPNNEILGLRLLLLLGEMKRDRRVVEEKTRQLLEAHPESVEVWAFYIRFKLGSIVDYKHSRLQREFEQISSYLFDKRINQVKSGREVWKIRKCGLIILAQVLTVHRLEGYSELCTAICCALLEFNIFCGSQMVELDRKDRLKHFKLYWEDYSNYKLGEYLQDSQLEQPGYVTYSWEGYLKRKEQNLQRKETSTKGYIGELMREISQSSGSKCERWLPCHSQHDSQEIAQHPDSFILFEDIELYLHSYRNIQNLQLLCNITMTNLNMPPIFPAQIHPNQPNHLTHWLSNTLLAQPRPSPYTQHCHPAWPRYWHPLLTLQFLGLESKAISCTQLSKFVYGVNLVECLDGKMKGLGEAEGRAVGEYLMFLYGTIYYLHSLESKTKLPARTTKQLAQLYRLYTKQHCLARIQSLLANDLHSIQLWSMYIEYECLVGKSVQECLDCYIGCLNTLPDLDQRDRLMAQLGALYYLSEYLYRWSHLYLRANPFHPPRTIVLAILKRILLHEQQELINLNSVLEDKDLGNMEKLLMGNKLKNLLKQEAEKGKMKKMDNECVVYYMLLEMGQSPATIAPFLLTICSDMSISMLVDFNLLDFQEALELMTKNISLKLVTYVCRCMIGSSRGILQHLREVQSKLAQAETRSIENRQLFTWLLIMRIMEPEYLMGQESVSYQGEYRKIMEYFLRTAQGMVGKSYEPLCIEIVSNLVSDPDLSYQWLNNYPFCRSLYSMAGLSVQNAARVAKLMEEKEIRQHTSSILNFSGPASIQIP